MDTKRALAGSRTCSSVATAASARRPWTSGSPNSSAAASTGGQVSAARAKSGVDYHALVIRNGDRALLSSPTTICRSWHPTEDPDLEGDDEELAVELDLHERGYRMCQCYSRFEPEGEFGHITEARLLAIPQADFQEALGLLHADDLPEYEECVYNAAADADRSPAACG